MLTADIDVMSLHLYIVVQFDMYYNGIISDSKLNKMVIHIATNGW